MANESREEFDLRKFVPAEEARKTFAKVFDKRTIQAVHRLATKGYFNTVEHVISTGKEAHVFLASDSAGNKRAIKIYKVATSDFNRMHRYLAGDRRFSNVRKRKKDIVFAWAKKEFKNLSLMNEAGILCPLPIASFENVLVMEFIADASGEPAPPMKELPPKDLPRAYAQTVNFLARLLFKAELIYADFSEYNILNRNEQLVLIDAGQAVVTTHPEAAAFFERDLRNMANYFSKQSLQKTVEQIKQDVKAMEGKI